MQQAFIGVDVGTASARAGVFDPRGALLATARHPIALWHDPGDIVEQSSSDIWKACVRAVRAAVEEAGLPPSAVAGIGFDATCSLVVLDPAARPLAIGTSGDPERNVIVWMDHRATGEARHINEGKHDVLRYVGGLISPEMETPKLLWLKQHLPQSFHAAGHFFDLADYLTFRATSSTARSACTVTCKWTYLAHERRWSDEYLRAIGLAELVSDGYARIGRHIVAPGTALARGLTAEAAAEFGLVPGTPVGASLIDAHAGAVGTLGAASGNGAPVEVLDRLAYIMGTSACIMATTAEPRFVPGIWGPYFSALLPGLWLNEGGQSAAGAGIDHLALSHPAHAEALAVAKDTGLSLLEFLERRAVARFGDPAEAALLARDIHVVPEFLGNRSPHADPGARAVIAGLDLDTDIASLERLFVSGICGLAYGLADVVDAMRAEGIVSKTMMISGGGARSALVRQIVADATGLSVALPETAEPVLLGAAMLGAVASKAYPAILAAMAAMSRLGPLTEPTTSAMATFHAAKRRVYAQMQQLDREARTIMADLPDHHGS
jgi:D-ribulokinase